MSIIKRLKALFPSTKWCGCSTHVEHDSRYQFRVRAGDEGGDSNLFQVREEKTCQECDDETIDVLVESTCQYDPYAGMHDRKVGVDEDDMSQYGFMAQDELVRMLIEMRMTRSLDLSESIE